ncbi:MAG: hypothetical protein U1C74_33255 [Phenylobacterium sp.]|nr:hypothetical protein [Phenylobacterium sp.]
MAGAYHAGGGGESEQDGWRPRRERRHWGPEAGVQTTTISEDLTWWRARREAADVDVAGLSDVLGRMKAWKDQHDADRARQPGPFLKMAWDGVFGDEDAAVADAISEIEAVLGRGGGD